MLITRFPSNIPSSFATPFFSLSQTRSRRLSKFKRKKEENMGKAPPKWLPGERVNETILLQRKSVQQLRADRLLQKDKLKDQKSRMKAKIDAKRKKKLQTKKFVSAAAILDRAVQREKSSTGYWKRGEKFNTRLNNKTDEKVAQQYANAGVALVVRTVGNDLPDEARKSLAKLGLNKMYQARMINLNPSNDRLTKMLKTFTTTGFPTVEQAETLIRTKGTFWNAENKSTKFISGNLQVEETLGQYNVLSIEELVDAVIGKSEHIDAILGNLAPFDLHPPRGLYMERHRTKREKMQQENPNAFSSYLEGMMVDTAREKAPAKKAAHKKKLQEAKAEKTEAKRVVKKTPAKKVKAPAAAEKKATPKATSAKKGKRTRAE